MWNRIWKLLDQIRWSNSRRTSLRCRRSRSRTPQAWVAAEIRTIEVLPKREMLSTTGIVVSLNTNPRIVEFGIDGFERGVLPTPRYPTDVALVDGRIAVVTQLDGVVAGEAGRSATTIAPDVNGLAIANGLNGTLYVGKSTGEIEQMDWNGTNRKVVASGFPIITGMAVDAQQGRIYVAGGRVIERIDLATGARDVIISGRGSIETVSYHAASGRIFWGDQSLHTVESSRVDGTDRRVLRSEVATPKGIAVDGETSDVFVADQASGTVFRSAADGSNWRVFKAGLLGLEGIALIQSGQPDNHAPEVKDLTINGRVNEPVTGFLDARDPEGRQLTYRAEAPSDPRVRVKLNQNSGQFEVLTEPTFSGSATFRWFATDDQQVVSAPGMVTVNIQQNVINGGIICQPGPELKLGGEQNVFSSARDVNGEKADGLEWNQSMQWRYPYRPKQKSFVTIALHDFQESTPGSGRLYIVFNEQKFDFDVQSAKYWSMTFILDRKTDGLKIDFTYGGPSIAYYGDSPVANFKGTVQAYAVEPKKVEGVVWGNPFDNLLIPDLDPDRSREVALTLHSQGSLAAVADIPDAVVYIHGREQSASSLATTDMIASLLSQAHPNTYVMALDWKDAADDFGLYDAAWADEIGRWLSQTLRGLGFKAGRTTLVGFSHGSYIAYETGKAWKETLGKEEPALKSIIALDPAQEVPKLAEGYNAYEIDFRQAAKASVALVAVDRNKLYDRYTFRRGALSLAAKAEQGIILLAPHDTDVDSLHRLPNLAFRNVLAEASSNPLAKPLVDIFKTHGVINTNETEIVDSVPWSNNRINDKWEPEAYVTIDGSARISTIEYHAIKGDAPVRDSIGAEGSGTTRYDAGQERAFNQTVGPDYVSGQSKTVSGWLGFSNRADYFEFDAPGAFTLSLGEFSGNFKNGTFRPALYKVGSKNDSAKLVQNLTANSVITRTDAGKFRLMISTKEVTKGIVDDAKLDPSKIDPLATKNDYSFSFTVTDVNQSLTARAAFSAYDSQGTEFTNEELLAQGWEPEMLLPPSLQLNGLPPELVLSTTTRLAYELTGIPAGASGPAVQTYVEDSNIVRTQADSGNGIVFTSLKPGSSRVLVAVTAGGMTSVRMVRVTVRLPVQNVGVDTVTPVSATVKWDAYPQADAYQLVVYRSGSDVIAMEKTVAGTLKTAVLTGLSAKTPYEFMIRALAGGSTLAESKRVAVTTPATPTLRVIATRQRQIDLSWTTVTWAKAVVEQFVEVRKTGTNGEWLRPETSTLSSTSLTVKKLDWNSSYEVRFVQVVRLDQDQVRIESLPVSTRTTTFPSVGKVEIDQRSKDSARVSFDQIPQGDPEFYRVMVYDSSNRLVTIKEIGIGNGRRSTQITGLKSKASYRVVIEAWLHGKLMSASPAVQFSTL